MTLINLLKKNPDARKIFGKKELIIIEKQLLGIELTQSEMNRLSRDIRPKLDFIRRASFFEQEFKLKKGAVLNNLIKETKNIILSDKDSKKIKKIILFGSTTTNTQTLNSDIDFAVVFGEISKERATIFRKRILGQTDERVDVQVFENLPKKIREDILTSGKIIYPDANRRQDR